MYRSIFCDRSPKSERCDIRLTPDTSRSCTETTKCNAGDWFIGPWSECFGDCFNLMRSRLVLCIKDEQIVADSMCSDTNNIENTTKPITIEKCELKDVSYCKPKWHYSEWTEVNDSISFKYSHSSNDFKNTFELQCTKDCGSGTQRRIVKCYEPDLKEKILRECDNCRYSERPQGFRSCNLHECDKDAPTTTTEIAEKKITSTKKHVEPSVRFIQNDSVPSN